MRRDANALLSSVFLALILGLGTYDYANGQNKLEVFTDGSAYKVGDTVKVFGTVPIVTANVPVTIELLDPLNTVYTIGQLIPVDGIYSFEFQLVDELATAGNWTVKATYADQEAFRNFIIVATESDIIETGYLLVNTTKDKYFGSEPITVFGTVPFVDEGLTVRISVDQLVSYIPPPDTVYTTELVPASDGTFSFNFTMPNSAENGRYQVQATYDDQNREVTFDYSRETPEIKIDSVTPNKPRWGLPVSVSGTVKAPEGVTVTVTVDWGDGTVPTSKIPVVGDTWRAENHTYDDKHIGENKIIAKLYEELRTGLGPPLNESEHTVNVLKHSTNLTLVQINTLIDNHFAVSGILYDVDAERGIDGKNITLGVSAIEPVIALTNSTGGYLASVNLSGNLSATELLFQSHFAGDGLYLASNNTKRYENGQTSEENVKEEDISLWWLVPVIAVIAAITIIILMNVPKPRRKPNIRKDASTVITLQAEVDIKRE